jgi:hypothetical protein
MNDKRDELILIRIPQLTAYLINKKGLQKYLTNVKADKRCVECLKNNEHKCDICKQYGGITHHGFVKSQEVEEAINEWYEMRTVK